MLPTSFVLWEQTDWLCTPEKRTSCARYYGPSWCLRGRARGALAASTTGMWCSGSAQRGMLYTLPASHTRVCSSVVRVLVALWHLLAPALDQQRCSSPARAGSGNSTRARRMTSGRGTSVNGRTAQRRSRTRRRLSRLERAAYGPCMRTLDRELATVEDASALVCSWRVDERTRIGTRAQEKCTMTRAPHEPATGYSPLLFCAPRIAPARCRCMSTRVRA
jgi:hypothetical protein